MNETLEILMIDDNPDELRFFCELLSRSEKKYNVTTALKASEGLKLLSGAEYNCTFIDYNMPEMDGMELLREIKKAHNKEIPIVMLTGDNERATRAEAAREGALDFLVKESHMSPEQLDIVIDKVMKWAGILNEKTGAA